ncbi:mitogen-activated protein kinase organizer 1 [Pelomyxa schiedti]|nr:mitogen-activated protein kinase organizer 1 [Pelomyxa schiedti]
MSKANLPTQEYRRLSGNHDGPINVIVWNVPGSYCLTGGQDRSISLWNPFTAKHIKKYRGHNNEILDITVSSDNSRIASCGGDRYPLHWDVGTGQIIRRYKGHEGRVNSVKFNEEDSVLITGSYDRSIKIWDCKSRSIDAIQAMDDAKDSVTSVAVATPLIYSSSVDGGVRCYDVRMGRLTTDQMGQPVTSVMLSNDRKCILAVCLDNTIRLIDRASGELLNEYTGHVNSNYKLSGCFSNTDAQVVCGSEDGKIFIWDLVSATVSTSIRAHSKTVGYVSYHPKHPCLLSCSVDGTAALWTSPTFDPEEEL